MRFYPLWICYKQEATVALCMLQEYHFLVDEVHARELLEVYNDKWKAT